MASLPRQPHRPMHRASTSKLAFLLAGDLSSLPFLCLSVPKGVTLAFRWNKIAPTADAEAAAPVLMNRYPVSRFPKPSCHFSPCPPTPPFCPVIAP